MNDEEKGEMGLCMQFLPAPSVEWASQWLVHFFWCRTSSSSAACQLDGLPIHICLCLSTWVCSRASFQSFLSRIIGWYHRGPSEYGSSARALLFGRSSQLGGFGAAVAYSGGIFWQGKLLTNSWVVVNFNAFSLLLCRQALLPEC